ncbi:exported protein of unknown function (plasmid) [Azospirillum baldaniorum]|uniref:Tripartite tricarboxylate transporter substrate binding protein n=1 Tax=Azospirillum baldaniorum TaxID=1064539 RepID=A0A9P1NRV8_9PROT|nr:exported protein of unknown function [Azospirillum baldaniorum]
MVRRFSKQNIPMERSVMTIRMPGAVKGVLTAAVLATAALAATPSLAEIKGLEIIAPASPGGGWDQHARTLQQVLQDQKLASGIQVVNIPGAGGTVGLAQFVTAKKRSPTILVGGQIMLGAIVTNKSAVTLDSGDPAGPPDRRIHRHRRPAGISHQDLRRPDQEVQGGPRFGLLGRRLGGRQRPDPGRADRQGGRRRSQQGQLRRHRGRRRAAGLGARRPCDARHGRLQRVRPAVPGRASCAPSPSPPRSACRAPTRRPSRSRASTWSS